MKGLYKILVMSLFLPVFCLAEEPAPAATPASAPSKTEPALESTPPVPPERPSALEFKKNYFGIGLAGAHAIGYGIGFNLSYGYRVTDQWILGGSVHIINTGQDVSGGGMSSQGQYYRHHTGYSSSSIEVDATYFFSEQGYKKFGFLLRGGLGQERGVINAHYKRYDNDPAWIQIGDGLRLRETGPDAKTNFLRNFVRIEPGYQFAWPRPFGSNVGSNTLEIALSFAIADRTDALTYTRMDGQTVSEETPAVVSTFRVSYIITL